LRIDVTPAASSARLRVFGVRPVATSSLSARNSPCVVVSTNSPSIWATWLACVCSSTSMPSMRKAAVTASPMAGSSRKNSVLRARIVTLLPSRAKACASSSATTDEPITARRSGMVSLTRASVEVQ
jgi:hypothetical protein